MYFKYAEEFIKTFPRLDQRYRKILHQVKNANCTGCSMNRLSRDLAHMVERQMRGKWDPTLLKSVMSEVEFSNIGKNIKRVVRKEREPCTECVIKHLSAAFILLNEVVNGHEDNKQHMYAELKQANQEGWDVSYKKLSLDDLRDVIVTTLDIDVSKVRVIGYLALSEELAQETYIKIETRKLRRRLQNEATKTNFKM